MGATADIIAEAVQQVTAPHQMESALLGPSKISTYLRCPRSYRYQYEERIKLPSSPAAALGTAVHTVARHIELARWTPDNMQTVADLMLQTWERVKECTADPSDPDANQGAELAAMEWLPWYLNWKQGQITVASEERWELTVPHTTLTLTGTIDRVYRASGSTVLSDIKTGKRKPGSGDLATDLQLTLYTWACHELGITPDLIELVMMRHKGTVQTTRTTAYLEAVMLDTVLPAAQGIAARIFPANPSSKYGCGFCDYQSLCAVGRGSMTEEK